MYYYRSQRTKSIELWRKAVKLRLEAHLQLSDNKEFDQAKIALTQAIQEWKLSMRTDKSGNSQYRLELDLDRLTECYANWGHTDKARQTYAQLIAQMKIPNDAHDNLHDLNEKLRKLGVLPKSAGQASKRR